MNNPEALKAWRDRVAVKNRYIAQRLGCSIRSVTSYIDGSHVPSRLKAALIEEMTDGEVPANLWPRKPRKGGEA